MKKIFLILGLVIIGIACNSKDDNPRPTKPEIATLLFPEKDQTCTQGVVIDQDRSNITFEWEPNKGADNFTLTVRNLLSNRIETYTTTETFKEITLSRNTPFSWFVISINTKSGDSTTSNLWKFYNAGEGVLSYPPFPAELLTPKSGSTTYSTTNIELNWNGTDVDNDISEYEVYLDSANPPTTRLVSGLTDQTYTLAPLTPNVYYWYVNTLDQAGNRTPSAVGQFKIE
ncbi:hypothetical protein [Galbibacter sp.]|uniref:hypothetical protein n=1 Tax=Galbibacter sp. TaxID=2918471 RepID=UPI003A944709